MCIAVKRLILKYEGSSKIRVGGGLRDGEIPMLFVSGFQIFLLQLILISYLEMNLCRVCEFWELIDLKKLCGLWKFIYIDLWNLIITFLDWYRFSWICIITSFLSIFVK